MFCDIAISFGSLGALGSLGASGPAAALLALVALLLRSAFAATGHEGRGVDGVEGELFDDANFAHNCSFYGCYYFFRKHQLSAVLNGNYMQCESSQE